MDDDDDYDDDGCDEHSNRPAVVILDNQVVILDNQVLSLYIRFRFF